MNVNENIERIFIRNNIQILQKEKMWILQIYN